MTSGEIAFYYTFFSVLAVQQVLEMGVGFTLKQYIAHAFKMDENGWVEESKSTIKGIFDFSIKWYFAISIFIFLGVGYFGVHFFSTIESDVDWKSPWKLLIALTAIFVNLIPFQLIIEGCQDQIVLYRSQLISSVINSVILVISITAGLGLYSIAISVATSNFILYFLLYTSVKDKYEGFLSLKSKSTFKSIFDLIWPMLSKLSITWVLGYFFWNSFNLVSIKELPLELAGKFALTLSFALAGYNIVSVVVNSQTTIFSAYISSGELKKALVIFNRSNFISIVILISGYGLYFLLSIFTPDFYIFNKTLSLEYTLYIFVYFLLLLPVTNQANFARCLKKEPYFYLSLCSNLTVPIAFYLVCTIKNEPDFKFLIFLSICFFIWSTYIFNNAVKRLVSTDDESLII
ncbi:hypothetical protein [Shewanella xiamenensis]|uniref:hypothetical protein n=1 Tax=Shewanella xiamenensis TaxID=332186 RepID=UPI00117E4F9B|nr:hypothetical protein [Shewanella xiamenensis]